MENAIIERNGMVSSQHIMKIAAEFNSLDVEYFYFWILIVTNTFPK